MRKMTIVCAFMLLSSAISDTDLNLWEAAKDGNLDDVKKALEAGGNHNWRNPNVSKGWTALHVASANNHPAVVSVLLEGGANKDIKDTFHGHTPLHWAVIYNNPATARVLLNAGANKDMLGDDGITPLYIAAEQGFTEIVKELIAHGADVNLPNGFGPFAELTPLMRAASNGHLDTVKELIGAHVNVRYSGSTGYTAIQLAYENDRPEIAKLLLQTTRDRNKQDGINNLTSPVIPSYELYLLALDVVTFIAMFSSTALDLV